jgi:hypothetical protein
LKQLDGGEMSANDVALSALERMAPHTFNALQYLVMAMDDYVKNAGKKTFFGKDKGHKAYVNLMRRLQQTVQSLVIDRQVQESTSEDDVLKKLESVLRLFQAAFPNWPDAYLYFRWMASEDRHNTLAIIARIRNA